MCFDAKIHEMDKEMDGVKDRNNSNFNNKAILMAIV